VSPKGAVHCDWMGHWLQPCPLRAWQMKLRAGTAELPGIRAHLCTCALGRNIEFTRE
jgi:hypothetical protein